MSKVTNTQHQIRSSFLEYLRQEFPYNLDWVHPISGKVWSIDLIKEKIVRLKEISPDNYSVLYSLWTGEANRKSLSQSLNCSATIINKRLHNAINTVLLLMIHPEVDTEILK